MADLPGRQDITAARAVDVLAAPRRDQQPALQADDEGERLGQLPRPRPASQAASTAWEVTMIPADSDLVRRNSTGST